MSPIYGFECEDNHCNEIICKVSDYKPTIPCPQCGKLAKRTFTPSGCFTGNQDARWIRGCLGMFNRHDSDPVVRKAFESPTRSNVMAAMKKQGISIYEGGKPGKSQTTMEYWNTNHDRIMRNIMKRETIEVNSR